MHAPPHTPGLPGSPVLLVLALVGDGSLGAAPRAAAAGALAPTRGLERRRAPVTSPGNSLETAASKAGTTGRQVAMSLIGLGFAIAAVVLSFRRDFKEAAGVFAVGLVAILLATPAGVSLLQDTVTSLFGAPVAARPWVRRAARLVVEIRSYRTVFELERRVYRIDRLRLPPGGIPMRGAVYGIALDARDGAGVDAAPRRGDRVDAAVVSARPRGLPMALAALLTVVRVEGRPFHRRGARAPAASARAEMAARPAPGVATPGRAGGPTSCSSFPTGPTVAGGRSSSAGRVR